MDKTEARKIISQGNRLRHKVVTLEDKLWRLSISSREWVLCKNEFEKAKKELSEIAEQRKQALSVFLGS